MSGFRARGFLGTLPARGDFVRRGLPAEFVAPWEAWIDRAVAASRALLGDAWRAAWMVGPVWRFALPAGACGADAALGILLPSIDRVGRCHPLAVVALYGPAEDAGDATPFLDAAEDAARDAIAADVEPDALAERIAAAPAPAAWGAAGDARWWTDGGPGVEARVLTVSGLPPMPEHADMLAGGGQR